MKATDFQTIDFTQEAYSPEDPLGVNAIKSLEKNKRDLTDLAVFGEKGLPDSGMPAALVVHKHNTDNSQHQMLVVRPVEASLVVDDNLTIVKENTTYKVGDEAVEFSDAGVGTITKGAWTYEIQAYKTLADQLALFSQIPTGFTGRDNVDKTSTDIVASSGIWNFVLGENTNLPNGISNVHDMNKDLFISRKTSPQTVTEDGCITKYKNGGIHVIDNNNSDLTVVDTNGVKVKGSIAALDSNSNETTIVDKDGVTVKTGNGSKTLLLSPDKVSFTSGDTTENFIFDTTNTEDANNIVARKKDIVDGIAEVKFVKAGDNNVDETDQDITVSKDEATVSIKGVASKTDLNKYVLISELERGVSFGSIEATDLTINGIRPAMEGHTHSAADIVGGVDVSAQTAYEAIDAASTLDEMRDALKTFLQVFGAQPVGS